MTTPAEQLFFFGQIFEAFDGTAALEYFAFLDLQPASGVVLAVVIISALLMGFWNDLSPWFSAGLDKLSSVVLGFKWLVQQLAVVRSRQELYTTLLLVRDRSKQSTIFRLLCQFMSAAFGWVFFASSPLVILFRLMALITSGVAAYVSLFLCGRQYLSGLLSGFYPTDWNMITYCSVTPRNLFYLSPPDRSQWLTEFHCLGLQTGMYWAGVVDEIQERLGVPEGEIPVAPVLAVALSCLLGILQVVYAYDAFSRAAIFGRTDKPQSLASKAKYVDQGTQLHVAPSSKRERSLELEMEALIKVHASECEQYKKTIEAQEERIAAQAQEYRATTQRMEKDRACFTQLPAPRFSVVESSRTTIVEPRQRDLSSLHLGQEVVKKDAELSKIQRLLEVAEEREEATRTSLSGAVERLESQLAERENEQAELQRSYAADVQTLNSQLLEARAQAHGNVVSPQDEAQLVKAELEASKQREIALATEYNHVVELGSQVEGWYNDAITQVRKLEDEKSEDSLVAEMTQLFVDERYAETERLEKTIEERETTIKEHETTITELIQRHNAFADGQEKAFRATLDTLKAEHGKSLANLNRSLALAVERADENERQVGICLSERDTSANKVKGLERHVHHLEHRLKEVEESRASLVTPTKRRTGDMGSIATALDQSRVEVAELQTQNKKLRDQLNIQRDSQPALQQTDKIIRDLQEKLQAEKRGRAFDQSAATSRYGALLEENHKLRIAQSNAALRPGTSPFSNPYGQRRPGSGRPL